MIADRVGLFDSNNIHELVWPDTAQANRVKRIMAPVIKEGVGQFIKNVESQVKVMIVGHKVFPVVVEAGGLQSHVGSLYGHYVVAACDEARKFANQFIRRAAQSFSSISGTYFWKGILSRNVQIDNWLVTTNLHDEISAEDVASIVNFLRSHYPDRAIIVRSLTKYIDEDIMLALKRSKFSFIASRQIYIWDYRKSQTFSIKARHALRKDDALASQAGYEWVDLDISKQDNVLRVLDLYRSLYLEKHSWNNPQYTEAFIRTLCAKPDGFLRIKVMIKKDRIDGFIGYYVNRATLTAPFIGYDTTLSQKDGLYRMLMSKLRQEAKEQNLVLNGSAGAGEFKRTRGGESITEFFAIYDQHLSWYYRAQWFLLRQIMNTFGMSVLRANVL